MTDDSKPSLEDETAKQIVADDAGTKKQIEANDAKTDQKYRGGGGAGSLRNRTSN